jgi:ATP-dependent DNA ligase
MTMREPPTLQAGRGLPQRTPSPQRAMADTILSKKMRAFDGGVALAVAQLYLVRMLQRTLPAGFIAPCLPTKTDKLPSGDLWLHEIKHDGFRVIARKDGHRVRLYSRPGNDMTRRFPLIAEALTGLRSRSCIIDGEAVACDDNGMRGVYRQ